MKRDQQGWERGILGFFLELFLSYNASLVSTEEVAFMEAKDSRLAMRLAMLNKVGEGN